MADAQGSRQFEDRNDGWVALPRFQPADVLLTEPRYIGERFLGHSAQLADAFHVPADQRPHVHTRRSADYATNVYQL